ERIPGAAGIGSGCALDVGQEPVADLGRALDQGTVAAALEDDLLGRAATVPVAVEHGPGLGDLRLGRVHLQARPAGDGPELAQGAEVEHRLVRDDLVLVAAQPQHGRPGPEVGEGGGVAPLAGEGVVDPGAAGGDPGPVRRGGGVARVAGVANVGQQDLGDELVLVGGLVGRRPEEGPHHHPGAGGRVVGGVVAGGQPADEVGGGGAAAGAGPVVPAGRPVHVLAAPEPVGGQGRDQGDAGQLVAVVDGVLLHDPAARGPAGDVDAAAARPVEGLDQGVEVVAPVAQPAGGVDRLALGPAEGAQVGGDQPVAGGGGGGHVPPETPR